jgi:hypothetical protein
MSNVPCKTHPDAPHGFLRNASHEADQYVCECAFWKPPREWVGRTDEISTEELIYMAGVYDGKKQRPWVGLTEDDVNNALYKYHGWREFAAELERLLKEKNNG